MLYFQLMYFSGLNVSANANNWECVWAVQTEVGSQSFWFAGHMSALWCHRKYNDCVVMPMVLLMYVFFVFNKTKISSADVPPSYQK